MTVRVCSLMWGQAYERYGHKFARSFTEFWPGDVELVIVTDRNLPLMRGRQIDLLSISACRDFRARWSDDPEANGRNCPIGVKVDDTGYSWRRDAVKWMPQAIAPFASIAGLTDGDIFVWFDADTETLKKVPEGWVESLLAGHDVACLQRGGTHTEIGFYAMRIGRETRSALRLFADFYIKGSVFSLKEWHSAYVWDRALETYPSLKVRNLNTGGGKGHVWPASPLSEFTLHRKGKRKDA